MDAYGPRVQFSTQFADNDRWGRLNGDLRVL